jgi:hypothetical protein
LPRQSICVAIELYLYFPSLRVLVCVIRRN